MEIYMGRDKVENEVLIQWGWEEDVWFHVDKLSSAHIYLRLKDGMTIDSIPNSTLMDCAHLTKGNSIQGCKQNNVRIVYTPWSNLNKTKREDDSFDWQQKRESHDAELTRKRKQEQKELAAHEKANKIKEEQEKKEQESLKNYSSLMREENMSSNIDNPIDEDDFM